MKYLTVVFQSLAVVALLLLVDDLILYEYIIIIYLLSDNSYLNIHEYIWQVTSLLTFLFICTLIIVTNKQTNKKGNKINYSI